MAVELATAYVSLVADTKQMPKQIASALGQAQAQADKAGVGIGSRISSGIGKTLKTGALAAGAAAGSAVAFSFAKGIGRLSAIDEAKAKLSGLGNDGAQVSQIMDNALNAVKGTAYGMGDAAGLAGIMVASGIKPGEQLESTLKRVADSAAITGSELGEMGQIWGKAAAKGKLDGEIVAQLMERQIPIYDILGKKMGVNADQVAAMVSKGKVSFQDFSDAMNDKIAGSAIKMGNTFKGSLKNVEAAAGRLGAKFLEPGFNRTGGAINKVTQYLDAATPKVEAFAKALDHEVFDKQLPKLRTEWEKFSKSDFALGTVSKSTTILDQLRSTAEATAPAVKDIGKALAEASAVTGGAGLTLGLQTLTGVTTAAAGPLTSALNSAANFAKENQTLVTSALMAYAGVRAINWAAQTKSMQGLQSAVTGTSGSFRTATGTMAAMRAVSASTGQEMSRLGAATSYLSTGQGSVGKLAQSFQSGRANAEKFGRTMGAASAAGTGLKVAASGVSSMLGGPLGIGLAVATIGLAAYGANAEKAAAHSRQISENARGLGEALAYSNGQLTATTQRAAALSLEGQKLGGTGRSITEYLESVGVSGGTAAKALAGSRAELEATTKVLEEQARLEEQANNERIGGGKAGDGFGASALGQLFNFGGGKDKSNEAKNALRDFQELQEEARRVAAETSRVNIAAGFMDASGTSTALGTLNEAMKAFAESSGGAADKVGILASGLSSIRGDQMSTEDAQQRVNSSLRNFSTALANGGAAAVDAGGKIDTATTAGDQLYLAMKGVQGAFDSAGAAAGQAAQQQGKSQEDIAAAARDAGQRVRDEFIAQATQILGTRAEAEALANQYGLFPDKLSTDVQLMTSKATADLSNFLNQPRTAYVDVMTRYFEVEGAARAAQTPEQRRDNNRSADYSRGGALRAYADGGIHNYLPQQATIQPGRGAGLVQWAEGETQGEAFIPLAPSKRGRSTDILADVAQRFGFGLTKFADGGIQNALNAGRANVKKYLWGGTGMDGWDCSGWVGWLQQIAMGATQVEAAGKRLYTTYSLLGGATAGLRPGLGPAGTQFQVGVSQEHMAATIGGIPAESGGAHGASRIGAPAVGATDPQFTNWFYLPNNMVAGGVDRSGIVSAYQRVKDAKPWDEDQEDELTEARLRVRQEEDSLSETRTKLAEGKATQVDLDRANLDLKRANKKVGELEAQKEASKAGRYLAPQAPELSKRFTDKETEQLEAQMALDEANDHRNEVYDNPESTERERLRADIDLSKAQDAFDDVLSGKNRTGQDYSFKGIAKSFLDRAGDAVIEGAFAQAPFGLGESRWLQTDWKSLIPDQTFTRAEIESQLPVTPGVSDWAKTVLDAVDAQKGGAFDPEEIRKRLNVYDSGGWLKPGDMAINLSSRPEPIFNSPDQLRQFAGELHAPESGSGGPDNSINFHAPVSTADVRELVREMRLEQKRQSYGFTRR